MNSTNMPWQKLMQAARNEPKKAGTLAVLVLVMAVAWAKTMTGGAGPEPAAASLAPKGGMTGAIDTTAARPLAAATAQPLQQWLQTPVAPLGRNLFVVRMDAFPTDPAAKPAAASEPKSAPPAADEQKERQILIDNVQAQASQLRLQSTIMGATPKALLNGEMVREGDVVASFRVSRIESRRIVVEREGIRLEIQMK